MSHVIDARGKRCPLPVIMLARLAADLPPGTEIEIQADDPAAALDIPAWCRLRGHTYLDSPHPQVFTVRLSPPPTCG